MICLPRSDSELSLLNLVSDSFEALASSANAGSDRECHFHPGASVGSSKSSRSFAPLEPSLELGRGRRSSVKLNPGMFREVYEGKRKSCLDNVIGCPDQQASHHIGSNEHASSFEIVILEPRNRFERDRVWA